MGLTGMLRGAVAAVLAASALQGTAADLAEGRRIARKCQTCHGIDGISTLPNAPNIAGQNPTYLEAQLRAFRSGSRTDPQMSFVARGLTDEEIEKVVAWYSAIEIDVHLPPVE